MYQYATLLSTSDIFSDPFSQMQEQCRSYLAALHDLSLVNEEYAYIIVPKEITEEGSVRVRILTIPIDFSSYDRPSNVLDTS